MTWLPTVARPVTASRYDTPRSNDRSPAAARRAASVMGGLVAVVTQPFNINLPTISKMASAEQASNPWLCSRRRPAYAQGNLPAGQTAMKGDHGGGPRIQSRAERQD